MAKIIFVLTERPFAKERPFVVTVPEPNYVVENSTLPIRVLASRYVKGELTGINVHPEQYSLETTPINSKGVDLCDFSDIQKYYDDMSKTQQNKYDSLQGQLKKLVESLRNQPQDNQPQDKQPKAE